MVAREAGSHVVAMRALLSTIGSRGDVQPLVALAVQLRTLGHEAHLCVPPDFRDWIEGLGFTVTTIGPELRKMTAASPSAANPMTPEMRRKLAEGTVTAQFETVLSRGARMRHHRRRNGAADRGSLGGGEVGPAVRLRGLLSRVLPSAHHPPPPLPPLPGQPPRQPPTIVSSGRGTPNGSTACSVTCSTRIVPRSD